MSDLKSLLRFSPPAKLMKCGHAFELASKTICTVFTLETDHNDAGP